jgi:diadenosine tetraphosphate (Ap4A) HIT family hydrolase
VPHVHVHIVPSSPEHPVPFTQEKIEYDLDGTQEKIKKEL